MQKIISGITVEIVKKDMKTLRLAVLPDGSVRVSAPKRTADSVIETFVSSHTHWIEKKRAELSQRQKVTPPDTLSVFGKPFKVIFERADDCSVVLTENEVLFRLKDDSPEIRQASVSQWYMEMLKSEISVRLPFWESRTGLYCDSWHIRDMKSRWGSCNTATRRLCFNLQLAKHDIDCLDYVILHETAHLKYGNHGAEFKALLDSYMPNWREIRKKLNGR